MATLKVIQKTNIPSSQDANFGLTQWEQDHCKRTVELAGYEVVEPLPSELFIDIDSLEQLSRFENTFETFQRTVFPCAVEVYSGKSRKKKEGVHIIIDMGEEISNLDRVKYQGMLHSDPIREILGLARIQRGISTPTFFIEKPEDAEKIRQARKERDHESFLI